MRPVSLPAIGVAAVLLLGVMGGSASADASAAVTHTSDAVIRVTDQEAPTVPAAGPVTTSAFTPTACPVALAIPGATEGQGYACGLVTVPQRHSDPTGTQIQIATVRILSSADAVEADPVVFAQGGSRGSGLDLVTAAPLLTKAFADRDLILFDQRGAGHSVPVLHCDEHDPVALAELTGQTGPADGLSADVAAYQACAARFAAAGYDLTAFDTLESAADVRDVVTALGYTDYDFYGVSEGTRVGQALLRDVPTGLRSVVLDSVEPTAVNTKPQRALTT